MTVMTEQEQLNQKMADAIKDFLMKKEVSADCRIYFNEKCYHFDSDGNLEKTLEGLKASEFFEFANDDTVAVSFEGPFYMVMNLGFENALYRKIDEEFQDLLESFGYYYELGHAWNLSLYK